MSDELKIFKSLFRVREDVFAIRWEKGTKSGYMPAYQFDPYFYRAHKIKGGNFNDFRDKSYLPFDDEQIEKHLIIIHNNSRHNFPDSAPKYFSRILHDYSDEKKGFIKWKDTLEERLV